MLNFCILLPTGTSSPIIEDHNGHQYNATKRIFNRKYDIKYYGRIHEEPLTSERQEPHHFLIQLKIRHDGYSQEVIEQKNKIQRNIRLVQKMIEEEPHQPKWLLFYAKHLKRLQDHSLAENIFLLLKKVIDSYSNQPKNQHLISALILICQHCLEYGRLIELKHYLGILKEAEPKCADIAHFEIGLFMLSFQMRLKNMVDQKIDQYLKDHEAVSYLHSNKTHIYHSLAITLFQAGFIDKSLNLLSSIPGPASAKDHTFFINIHKKLGDFLEMNENNG